MGNFIPFEDKDFETLVKQEFKNSQKEIFSLEYQNKKYWIKKGRKTSSNIFHKIFYRLLPFEVLIPVETKTAVESILFETTKLKKFDTLGVDVPKVIASNEEFFVLSDCGRDIYGYLKYSDASQKQFDLYLKKYILALGNIHNLNEYHGGAQSRNFTYSQNKVFAIDLEDSFDKSVDIITLQFRDLLLLLLSMSKIKNYDFSYKEIVYLYVEETNNSHFINKLKDLSKSLRFLIFLYNKDFIKNIMPRDLKDFCRLLKELEEL
ncbi:kinase [Halarcobacter mediterraneus]|uniref:Kinase n=1 Tax=Halarcobacter mediterraneus TaxID=2023153 RepID=A0A4V1M154_9BACT|nr:kinase [Halarcobacter mediterraneus]RXK12256.1 kinase [Halarcobacter mediterraneus]